MADPIPPQGQTRAGDTKIDESIGLRLVVDFNQWVDGLRKSEKAVSGFGDVVEEIAQAIPKGFEESQRRLEISVNAIVGKIQSVRNTFLKLEAGIAATTLAMAQHSAGLERSMYMMERLAERTGKSVSSVYKVIEDNMGGVAAKADLIRGSIHMMNTELNPAQMDKFIKIVKDASAAMGTDFAHSMEFAVKSVQTLNTNLLTNIGLVIRQEEVLSRALRQNAGVTPEALTPQMKQQAMLTLIEERSKRFAGSHEQLMGRGTYQWSDAKQNLADIAEELGRVFIPAWAKAAEVLTKFTAVLKGIVQNEYFQAIGKAISNVLIPFITAGAVALTSLAAVLTLLKPIILAIPFIGLALGISKVTAALTGNQGLTPAMKEAGKVIEKTWMGTWKLMTDGTWSAIKALGTYKKELENVKVFGTTAATERSALTRLVPGLDVSKMGLAKEAEKVLKKQYADAHKVALDAKSQFESDFKIKERTPSKLFSNKEKVLKEIEELTKKRTGTAYSPKQAAEAEFRYDEAKAANEAAIKVDQTNKKILADTVAMRGRIEAEEKRLDAKVREQAVKRKTTAQDSAYAATSPGMTRAAEDMRKQVKEGLEYTVQGPFLRDVAKAAGISSEKSLLGNIRAAFTALTKTAGNTGSAVGGIITKLTTLFEVSFGTTIPRAIGKTVLTIASIGAKLFAMVAIMTLIGSIIEKIQKRSQEQKFGSEELEQEYKQLEERKQQIYKGIKKQQDEFDASKRKMYLSTDEIKAQIAKSKGTMSVDEIQKLAAPGMSALELAAAKTKRAYYEVGDVIMSVFKPIGYISDTADKVLKEGEKRRKQAISELGVNWEALYGAKTLKTTASTKEDLDNMNKSVESLSENLRILNKGLDEYVAAERGAAPVIDGTTEYLKERLAVYASLTIKAKEYAQHMRDLEKRGDTAIQQAVKSYVTSRIFAEGVNEKPEDIKYEGPLEGGTWSVKAGGRWMEEEGIKTRAQALFGHTGVITRREGPATRGEKLAAMNEEDRERALKDLGDEERKRATAELEAVKKAAKEQTFFQERYSVDMRTLYAAAYDKKKKEMLATAVAIPNTDLEGIEARNKMIEEEAKKTADTALEAYKKMITGGMGEIGYNATKKMMEKMAEAMSDKANFNLVSEKAFADLKAIQLKMDTARLEGDDKAVESWKKKYIAALSDLNVAWYNHVDRLKANSKTIMSIYAADARMVDTISKQVYSKIDVQMPINVNEQGGARFRKVVTELKDVEKSITDIEEAQRDFTLDAMQKEFLQTSLVFENMNDIAGQMIVRLADIGYAAIQTNELTAKAMTDMKAHFATLNESFVSLYDRALEKQKQIMTQYRAMQKEATEYNAKIKESSLNIVEAQRQTQAARREAAVQPTPGYAAQVTIGQMRAATAQAAGGAASAAEIEKDLARIAFTETQKQRIATERQIGQGSPEEISQQIAKTLDLIMKEFQSKLQLVQLGDKGAAGELKALGGKAYEEDKIRTLNEQREKIEAKIIADRVRAAELQEQIIQVEARMITQQYQLRRAQMELELKRQATEFDIINAQRNQTEHQLAAWTLIMRAMEQMSPNNTGIGDIIKDMNELAAKTKAEGNAAKEVQDKVRRSTEELKEAIEENTKAILASEAEKLELQNKQRRVKMGLSEEGGTSTAIPATQAGFVSAYPYRAGEGQGMTSFGAGTSREKEGLYSSGIVPTAMEEGNLKLTGAKPTGELAGVGKQPIPQSIMDLLADADPAKKREGFNQLMRGFTDVQTTMLTNNDLGRSNESLNKAFNEKLVSVIDSLPKNMKDAVGELREQFVRVGAEVVVAIKDTKSDRPKILPPQSYMEAYGNVGVAP